MSLSEVFPLTAAAYPALLDWGPDFDWSDNHPAILAGELTGKLEDALDHSLQAMLHLTDTIRRDLAVEAQRLTDSADARNVDGFRFLISIPAIQATLAEGLHGDCYNWVHVSASRTHDPARRANEGIYELPPYAGASDALNLSCIARLPVWTTCAFLLARKFGGMDEWCRRDLDYCLEFALAALAAGDVTGGIDAIAAIVNWGVDRDDPRAQPLTRVLESFYRSGDLDRRSKASLGIFFTTAANRWTSKRQDAWAAEILTDYADVLREHEVVQLMSVTINTVAAWQTHRDRMLQEIRLLADAYRQVAGDEGATLALESRVAIIHPLLFSLTEFGTTADLMDTLWAWYGREGERADDNILYVASAHGDGVTFVWPEGRYTVANPAAGTTLDVLLENLSVSLNEYFRGPAGDRQVVLDERMIGAPNYAQAGGLIDAMAAHYRLDELQGRLPEGWRPRSLVVLPAHRDPVQALLASTLDWLAPLEASVARPLPTRPIRILSIWPGETQTTASEVAFLQALAARAGWEIKVASSLEASDFQTFYEDTEADLLWVIGHGEQSPFRMSDSGLVLGGEQLLTAAQIAGFARPKTGRRLLVLNICSASATQNRGGLARVGLAHDLATADQAVVGHLWPTDYYAALAFGCAFAANLSRHEAPEALRLAQSQMRRHDALIETLASVSPGSEAVDRLSSQRAMTQVEHILSWGSAILLT